MKISFVVIGKTTSTYLVTGIKEYQKRLQHYTNFNYTCLPALKKSKHLSKEEILQKEAAVFMKKINQGDWVILLDERGREQTSVQFAATIEVLQQRSIKQLKFIVGGAYGFHGILYQRANAKLSLSKLTFSHQMVRLIFLEQLYRAFTIIRNEPYHHE